MLGSQVPDSIELFDDGLTAETFDGDGDGDGSGDGYGYGDGYGRYGSG